jgi:hypothetical protein
VKHNPEPWQYVNVHDRRERSAHGVVEDRRGVALFDTLNADAALIRDEHDDETGETHRWDEIAEANLGRAVRCVNFLRGVPDEALDKYTVKEGERRHEAVAMLLHHLAGDAIAALTYADEVQALAQLKAGQTFVRRDELVEANGTLAAAVGRKELRHIRTHLLAGRGIEPDLILARIHAALGATDKCDPTS